MHAGKSQYECNLCLSSVNELDGSTILFRIREITHSVFNLEVDYPYLDFLWFYSIKMLGYY
jgi:hypothetical protein